jgi:DNA repair exonuclease SbcCD ATPase subunit
MTKVYQLVREVVQGNLHRKKPDIMVSAGVKNIDRRVDEAIEELEKFFVDGVGRLKSAVGDNQAVVASEAQHAEQVIEDLKANITGLEARLRETEDTLDRKNVASQKMEEVLSAEIGDLQSVVKNNEEALENRNSEVTDLKLKINVLTEQVTQLESTIQQAKGEAVSEAQRADQIIEGLKANISLLEGRLKETEDTVHRKEVASQKMEESLSTEICDLQSVVKKKEEALENRNSEVNDLKSKIDVLTEQVTQFEAIEQAKGEAATEAQHAEQVIEGLKIKIGTLQAQLSQTEQMVAGLFRSWPSPLIVESVSPIDLHAQLESQTNGTKHSKAEALVDIQAGTIGTAVEREQLKTGQEQSTGLDFRAAGVTPIAAEAAPKTVSQDVLDRVIAEFSELTNVMGSIASLIVRGHVRALGESIEEFPRTQFTKLLESLSKDISDDKLKADFCTRFGNI